MRPHLRYLSYVLRHKWHVFRAGLTLGVPLWQLVTHDASKFGPAEWRPYVRYFYDQPSEDAERVAALLGIGIPRRAEIAADFERAWNHHQKANAHHWQYWLILPDERGDDWKITSPDGGMRYFGLANYTLFPGRNLCIMDATGAQGEVDAARLAEILNRLPRALPMPERYIREMAADWIGAGLALGKSDCRGWYEARKQAVILHPATRVRLEALLDLAQQRGLIP